MDYYSLLDKAEIELETCITGYLELKSARKYISKSIEYHLKRVVDFKYKIMQLDFLDLLETESLKIMDLEPYDFLSNITWCDEELVVSYCNHNNFKWGREYNGLFYLVSPTQGTYYQSEVHHARNR